MFTHLELLEKISNHTVEKDFEIEELVFTQDDFDYPSGEESIVFHKALKNNFYDAIDFYLKSLDKYAEVWNGGISVSSETFKGHYYSQSLNKTVSKEEFVETISRHNSGLIKNISFELNGQWIDGMIMTNDWDDFNVIGETNLEYYSFYWSTTA